MREPTQYASPLPDNTESITREAVAGMVAFRQNIPCTLPAVARLWPHLDSTSPLTLERRLRGIGCVPATEERVGNRRAPRLWWWPIDVATALWGEEVARQVVDIDNKLNEECQAADG